MTNHGRKYGEKDSHPIPLWNGVFEHYGRIGDAIWEFAWCIDKITEERDGVGLVLGGAPVKIGSIVRDLRGSRKESVRRHMSELEAERYIRRRRTPYGCVIEVLNSQKFGIWKRREKPKTDTSLALEKPKIETFLVPEKPTDGYQIPKIVVSKEDTAVDTAVRDAAAKSPAAKSGLWEVLRVRSRSLQPELRQLCEGMYANKGNQTMSEFLGLCLDLWADQGNKIPPQLAKATAEVRERERQAKTAVHERPELEELPWAKR